MSFSFLVSKCTKRAGINSLAVRFRPAYRMFDTPCSREYLMLHSVLTAVCVEKMPPMQLLTAAVWLMDSLFCWGMLITRCFDWDLIGRAKGLFYYTQNIPLTGPVFHSMSLIKCWVWLDPLSMNLLSLFYIYQIRPRVRFFFLHVLRVRPGPSLDCSLCWFNFSSPHRDCLDCASALPEQLRNRSAEIIYLRVMQD